MVSTWTCHPGVITPSPSAECRCWTGDPRLRVRRSSISARRDTAWSTAHGHQHDVPGGAGGARGSRQPGDLRRGADGRSLAVCRLSLRRRSLRGVHRYRARPRRRAPRSAASSTCSWSGACRFRSSTRTRTREVQTVDSWGEVTEFGRLSVDHWHAGGTQEFGAGAVRPFLIGTSGLTRFGAPGDSELRFSMAAGGGVKLMPTRHLGLRLDGRVYAVFVDGWTSAGVVRWCRLPGRRERQRHLAGGVHRGSGARVLRGPWWNAGLGQPGATIVVRSPPSKWRPPPGVNSCSSWRPFRRPSGPWSSAA